MERAETTATMTHIVGTVPQLPIFLKSRNTWGIPCWERPSARTSRPRSEEKPDPMNLSSLRIPMKPLSMKKHGIWHRSSAGKQSVLWLTGLTPTACLDCFTVRIVENACLMQAHIHSTEQTENLRCRQQLPLSNLQIHVRRVYDALYQGIHSGQSGG